jgi:anthranilate/para-aminobenzoate synthase component II
LTDLTADTPIFGVCLGMQCIGQAFGGEVIRAPQVNAWQDVDDPPSTTVGVFRGLPNPVEATRYHSLIVERDTLPDALEITAETDDGLIMGLRHRQYARSRACSSIPSRH